MSLRVSKQFITALFTLAAFSLVLTLFSQHEETWEMTAWKEADLKKHNAQEDQMLQGYMLGRKANLKIKGVITLIAHSPRYDKLLQCLELLYNHFNHRFGYPVVIFHEADFIPRIRKLLAEKFIKRKSRRSVFFQQIDLSVPDWYIKKFGQPPKDVCGAMKHFGYRSMCRFQAKLVYDQPIMRHFDYHWRLDDDSLIIKNIGFDVFAALKDGGFTYGYHETDIDTCASNVVSHTVDYMKSRKIVPTFFPRLKVDEVFFNNFEVSNMKLWRSKEFAEYFDYMDSLGGFYTHRWGDAPIKTLFLSMFTPVSEIFHFSNVTYTHHNLHSIYMTKFLEPED